MRGVGDTIVTARKVIVVERLFQLAYPYNRHAVIKRHGRTIRRAMLPKNIRCVSASYLFVV
jgi:hypothetical protein